MARTVDHMSDGRLILGIGSGWFEKDYQEYGYEFGTAGGRLNQLRDDLPRIESRWAKLNPAPTRKIPVLIGGGGEKKTLRLVAQYAQACNLFDGPELEHKLDVLRGHCERLGRDYDDIQKTVLTVLFPGDDGEQVEEILEQLRGLSALGVTHVHVGTDVSPRSLEIFGEQIIPAAKAL